MNSLASGSCLEVGIHRLHGGRVEFAVHERRQTGFIELPTHFLPSVRLRPLKRHHFARVRAQQSRQHLARPGYPAGYGAGRHFEDLGGLRIGVPFDAHQHHGRPMVLRQTAEGLAEVHGGRKPGAVQLGRVLRQAALTGGDLQMRGPGPHPPEPIDPLGVDDAVEPAVEPRAFLDLGQTSERPFAGRLDQIVRPRRIFGQGPREAAQPRQKPDHLPAQGLVAVVRGLGIHNSVEPLRRGALFLRSGAPVADQRRLFLGGQRGQSLKAAESAQPGRAGMAFAVPPLAGRIVAPAVPGIGCTLSAMTLAFAPAPAVAMAIAVAVVPAASAAVAAIAPMAAAMAATSVPVATAVAIPVPIIPAVVGQGGGRC